MFYQPCLKIIYHLLFLSDVLDFNNSTESSRDLNQLNNEEFITSLLNTVIKHVKVSNT